MPDDYFADSQSPVIRVEQSNNAFTTIVDNYFKHEEFKTEFTANEFKDNQNYQVVTVPDASYYGSLLEWDCLKSNSIIGLYDNIVNENTFFGRLGALFYINGGLARITGNQFTYNGRLTTQTVQNNPSADKRVWKEAYFPFEEYIFDLAQTSGIFTFEFKNHDMPEESAHLIQYNTFKHIYCLRGCAYSARGDKIQQFAFSNNDYSFMVSKFPGAVFDGSNLSMPPSNEYSQVWLQTYIKEKIHNTFGGAIYVAGENVPTTVIEDTSFYNNFGDQGASLSFFRGGGLFCRYCYFHLDQEFREGSEGFVDNYDSSSGTTAQFNHAMATKSLYIKGNFTQADNALPRQFLVDDEFLNDFVNNI